MVFGLPLRFGRTCPLISMLAEAERDLNMARENLGRFAGRLLECVKDDAGAKWKGRRIDSLVGVTRISEQGNVNGLELILSPPPIRATSCIQLASRLSWRWAALPTLHFSMPLLEAATLQPPWKNLLHALIESRAAQAIHAKPF